METIANAGKLARALSNPMKYVRAIGYRELVYRRTKKEKFVKGMTFWGDPIHLLLPSSTDIFLTGGKTHHSEIRLARYLSKVLNPGMTFLDIGAHYGFFSMMAANLVGRNGRVIAFEASPVTFAVLEQNESPVLKIEKHNLAISSATDTLTFYEFPNLYSEYNTLNIDQYQGESWFEDVRYKEIQVPSQTLDAFVGTHNEKIDVIKLDVEGAEDLAVSGGLKYLKDNNPVLIMEFLGSDRGNHAHIRSEEQMRSVGFQAYHITESGELLKLERIAPFLQSNGIDSDNIVFKKG